MTGPLILITLGVLLLLQNLYPQVYSFGRVWPVILIVIGIGKIAGALGARRGNGRNEGGESQ